jgi:hypothetical protein
VISTRLATVFAAGQLAGVFLTWAGGVQLGAGLAEVGVAASVALLAREALRPPAERRRPLLPVVAAGVVHGLGLAALVSPAPDHRGSTTVYFVLIVLGMDACLLLATFAGAGLRNLVPRASVRGPLTTAVVYVVAIGAVALALGFPGAGAESAARETAGIRLPELQLPEGGSGNAASRRIASRFPQAAFQSFVTVAPFEVRHEVLVRVRDVAERIGLDRAGDVAADAQDELKESIGDLVARRTSIAIDRRTLEPADLRVDFLTLDSSGALPRLTPVPEPVEAAWIGVTTVYITESTPDALSLTWSGLDDRTTVPATVTDPESSRSVELTRRRPELVWTNELAEDPTPIVTTVAVEPPMLWVPLLSFGLLGTAVGFGVAAVRGRRRERWVALARIALAGAFLLGPVAGVVVPLPLFVDKTPGEARSKRILSRLLPNVYRAFEFPTESACYDRMALSVTGDTLGEIYLEHRRAVTMEERGGAKARVEAVEVVEVGSVSAGAGAAGGFVADAIWTVGGTVTHFGHRHFRQNRYNARIAVVPTDGNWKIRSIDVRDATRVR